MHSLRPLICAALLSLAAAAPATAPDNALPPQTGELTLKFTQRSPLSSRAEVARRLSCKESDLHDDYDLTTFAFTAYVPRNYDPAVSYGVFFDLGTKDLDNAPAAWEPLFDKSHMIFITPRYRPLTREWHMVGLGFDAVDNLKRLYTIDAHRLYELWFGTGSLQMPLAGADVFTGMIVGEDWHYFRKIVLPGYRPADTDDFPRPPIELLRKAKSHGVVLITLANNPRSGAPLISTGLKQDGFDHVLSITVTSADVHYPYLSAGSAKWITDPVLPFLDKFAQQNADAPTDSSTASTTSPSAGSDAQHLLSMAKLYIDNGKTDLARTKLQSILARYPNDPAAVPAKKLLDSLPPPASPPQ